MNFTNPLKKNEEYIREEDGKFFMGKRELMPLTSEQKKISKTDANYYFEDKEHGNQFFCHLDAKDKVFFLAETISDKVHDVWLKDMKSITFYEGNIVLRDANDQTSQAFRDEKEMTELINKEYASIKKEKEIVLFEDPLKEQQIGLEKDENKWFLFKEEIFPITEEQKKISKTEANYALTKDGLTFFYKLDEETKKFALSETVGEKVHDVWLKNNKSISYSKQNVILKDNTNHKLMDFDADSDFSFQIKETYDSFKTPSIIINNRNEIVPESKNENASELGYIAGLKKQLRSHDDTPTMMVAFGVHDMITKGTGLKKHKFLKLGTAAGVVALIAASPIAMPVAAGAVVLGTLATIGAAVHTAAVTGDYTAGYIGKKIKNIMNKSNEALDEVNAPVIKDMYEVKSTMSKLRSEAFDAKNERKQTNNVSK